jgi:hypothetical protein
MDNFLSNRRSDEQLEAILCETSRWAVNGRLGQVLGYAASLRVSGTAVIAIADYPLTILLYFLSRWAACGRASIFVRLFRRRGPASLNRVLPSLLRPSRGRRGLFIPQSTNQFST